MAPSIYYLSPHPDDVALSCGGSVAADASSGAAVTLLSVFNVGADKVRRDGEDREAALILGCAHGALGLPDAPERPEVRGRLGLFAPLSPRHLGILSEVVARLRRAVPEGAQICAPLAVGGHIDHRLVHSAARALCQERAHKLSFYEDQPYSLAPYAVGRRMSALSAQLATSDAPARGTPAEELSAQRRYLLSLPISRRLAPPGLRTLALHIAARAALGADRPGHEPSFAPRLALFRREVEAQARRRFAAIAAYASQWPLLFPSLAEMERALRRCGGQEALTERFWHTIDR